MILLLLALLLAACGTSETEPTAAQGEITKVAPGPSLSVSESVIAPTWTAMPTKEPPQATAEPTMTAAVKASQTPSESTKTPIEAPNEPVIIFQQEGGIMGMMKTWEIFADGTVASEGTSLCQVDPAMVQILQGTASDIGFFDAAYTPPKNFCCDFFTFTLTISSDDEVNTVVVSDGDPNMPLEIRELISSVQEVVNSCESGD